MNAYFVAGLSVATGSNNHEPQAGYPAFAKEEFLILAVELRKDFHLEITDNDTFVSLQRLQLLAIIIRLCFSADLVRSQLL